MKTIIDTGYVSRSWTKPYRAVVLKPALPEDLYLRLLATRPDWKAIAGTKDVTDGNVRVDIGNLAVFERKIIEVAPIWKRFMETHMTVNFYYQICELLGVEPVNNKRDFQFLPRGRKQKNALPVISMDCQIGINTPNIGRPASVRGPHVDHPTQLVGGMLYMPVPGDEAGGDLTLYRLKVKEDLLKFHGKAAVVAPGAVLDEFHTVKYEPNTAIFWENSRISIHGVTPRQSSCLPRQMVNFIYETQYVNFEV